MIAFLVVTVYHAFFCFLFLASAFQIASWIKQKSFLPFEELWAEMKYAMIFAVIIGIPLNLLFGNY
jgi:hypothetical protein